ncbi:MAG: TetR/AcrR family transcriptional regulator [Brevundimonas sp.]|uniref:TetR/AcrR family transcriptional regulator n=1 Tax=Brevundimonas sp. TaxID=1871086 RepID=UPI0039192406
MSTGRTALAERTARPGRKPKGEGHVRRQEILDAAERIFVEEGYEGATIRKIAEAVGVSSTALYMHFRDKSHILTEICEAAFETLIKLNRDIMDRPMPAQAKLRALMESYIRFGFEHPNAYRLIYCTRPREAGDGAQEAARRVGSELFRRYRDVVADVVRDNALDLDVDVAAQTLWAGAHGLVSLIITKPYFEWAEREALSRHMLDALFMGLERR